MKAALIATGDEVVSGQIVNTNASFLASELTKIGVEVVHHFAVLDQKEHLNQILNFLIKSSVDVVFTIGGLGPTRDDVTREVISKFAHQELELDEGVWSKMEASLLEREIKPREGHKWQAYFPKGAVVFKNVRGTAQAFSVVRKKLIKTGPKQEEKIRTFEMICLPGPPSELESVLKKEGGGLLDEISKKSSSSTELISWQCINIPESEIAHEVEKALIKCSYQVGYRASPPITEVKLWIDKKDPDANLWQDKLDAVCKPYLYSKNAFSYIDSYIEKLLSSSEELYFIDRVTNGRALEEIKKNTKKKIFKKLCYAYGKNFETTKPAMLFEKSGEVYTLTYKNIKKEFSLKNKNVFRSKRSSIYALLMLFKMHYETQL